MFSRIFEAGIYNCVTASMLYALILDHYQIPYEIKEKPTHIYLVALPGKDNILFETTNPRGLYVPDEKFKRDYVNSLVQLKYTTQEHVNEVGLANALTSTIIAVTILHWCNWPVCNIITRLYISLPIGKTNMPRSKVQ